MGQTPTARHKVKVSFRAQRSNLCFIFSTLARLLRRLRLLAMTGSATFVHGVCLKVLRTRRIQCHTPFAFTRPAAPKCSGGRRLTSRIRDRVRSESDTSQSV